MKTDSALVGVLLVLFGVPSLAQEPSEALKNLEVVGVSDRPAFGSGYVAAYVRIDFKAADDARFPVYMIYAGEEQRVPASGDKCDVQYTMEAVRGSVGGTSQFIPYARLARVLDCRYRVVSIRWNRRGGDDQGRHAGDLTISIRGPGTKLADGRTYFARTSSSTLGMSSRQASAIIIHFSAHSMISSEPRIVSSVDFVPS